MPAPMAPAASHAVPAGSDGVVKTALTPFGVVYAAGEEWTARSETGADDPAGSNASASSARMGLPSSSRPGRPASCRARRLDA